MATKKFKCTVCGYIHEGKAAPETCPVCAAPASAFVEIEDAKKKGMLSDKTGNAYIIMYSTVMVVIVATLLAVAALSLQKRQYANELNEKKSSILSSLSAQDQDYDTFIDAYVVDARGEKVEGQDVFELLKDLQGAFDDGKFPVFEAKDGRVVIPVTGTGLWGPYHHGPQGRDPGPGCRDRHAEIPGAVRRQENLQGRRVRFREAA